jgi:hypothetical protein
MCYLQLIRTSCNATFCLPFYHPFTIQQFFPIDPLVFCFQGKDKRSLLHNTMLFMTSSLILILAAAPSIASSFIATTFPRHNNNKKNNLHNHNIPTMTLDGDLPMQQQHRSGSSAKNRHRIWSVSPGGSLSETQPSIPPAPSKDDNSDPMIPPTPPSTAESQANDASDAVPSPPLPPSSPPPPIAAVTSTAATGMGPNSSDPGLLRKTFSNLPWHRLPNMLTYMRCVAIPTLVVLFYLPHGGNSGNGGSNNIACGVIFGLAAATDWLDGYLARRWDITTSFGAFLDPVADKLMVSTSLILLTGRFGKGTWRWWPFVFLTGANDK